MATKVYGASDDLIEFEGDVSGEVCYVERSREEAGCLLMFSDGTVIAARYGKPGDVGVWALSVVLKGSLLDRIDTCTSEDAEPHSDVAHFRDGLLRAFAAKKWERVT